MTNHYHQPINITAKEWRNYELQSLARACVNLARINQRLTRLTTALCQRQPTITCGQHYHWLSYELDSVPFLVVHQSQPVVKLPARTMRHLLRLDGVTPWCLIDRVATEPGWAKLSLSLNDKEWLYWASKALAYAKRQNVRS